MNNPKQDATSLRQFDRTLQVLSVRIAREMGYRPSFLVELVRKEGAVKAVRRLLHKPSVSSTFLRLQAAGRLDLAVESLVVHERWARLFTDRERAIASARLALGAQDVA